jgi:hypothetical protein
MEHQTPATLAKNRKKGPVLVRTTSTIWAEKQKGAKQYVCGMVKFMGIAKFSNW